MNDALVSLSGGLSAFIDCAKQFTVFDVSMIFNLSSWTAYEICETLVSAGIINKIDMCPDDSDLDDIIYIPKSRTLFGEVFIAMQSLDEEVMKLL
jgi:hypothetical protein